MRQTPDFTDNLNSTFLLNYCRKQTKATFKERRKNQEKRYIKNRIAERFNRIALNYRCNDYKMISCNKLPVSAEKQRNWEISTFFAAFWQRKTRKPLATFRQKAFMAELPYTRLLSLRYINTVTINNNCQLRRTTCPTLLQFFLLFRNKKFTSNIKLLLDCQYLYFYFSNSTDILL